MDDLEFDFEDDIKATDVGQPEEAPEDLPDRARKNYRQVRPHPVLDPVPVVFDRHRRTLDRIRHGRCETSTKCTAVHFFPCFKRTLNPPLIKSIKLYLNSISTRPCAAIGCEAYA